MARSGKQRHHRELDPGHRQWADGPPGVARVFRITDAQRERVATALRYIDEARRALEGQQNPDNREIIRELRTSADVIFDLLNGLDETES